MLWTPATRMQELALSCPARFLLLGGSKGSLKCLAEDTPIPTPTGWTTMGALAVGDAVFDEQGGSCQVTHISETFADKPAFCITFHDGEHIVATGDHLWPTFTPGGLNGLRTTQEIKDAIRDAIPVSVRCPSLPRHVRRNRNLFFVSIEQVPTVPTRCIAVDSPSHLYLAGRGFIPTHNTSTLLMDGIAFRDRPKARSILFRRTVPELQQTIERAGEMFRDYGATQWEGGRRWEFPSGMQFYLRGAGENEADIFKYQGWELDWIGFDESTQFTEKPIRTLLHSQRAKAGDNFLQEHLRFRLGTNPGFVGASWHKHAFIGDGCFHCTPVDLSTSSAGPTRQPGRIYTDAKWLTDGTSIGLTTCFLPGRVSDHHFYDTQDYEHQMRGFSADMRRKFREGCWLSLEGLYFDCWDEQKMVVDARSLNPQWWWTQWTGTDYGYSISAAASIRFAQFHDKNFPQFPDGRTIAIAEYVSPRETAKSYGKSLYDLWYAEQKMDGEFRANRIVASYLSPDCFGGDRGNEEQRDLREQMEDGADYKIGFDKASNDRAAGSMRWYTMLETGELVIDTSCKNLRACIVSRVRNPDRPLDILKIKGDPLDDVADACFVAGTMISVPGGQVPIENVKVGDLVLTRQGSKMVVAAGSTGVKQTRVLHASDGTELCGTGNHPVWIERHGFKRLDELRYGDNMLLCPEEQASRSRPSCSTGSPSVAIHKRSNAIIACTSAPEAPTEKAASAISIKRYGNLSMGRYQRAIISTTLTRTPPTMTLETYRRSWGASTSLNTCCAGSSDRNKERILTGSGRSPRLGTDPRRARNGIASTPQQWIDRRPIERANSVDLATRQSPAEADSAQMRASRRGAESLVPITSTAPASSAGKSTREAAIRRGDFAASHVLSVRTGPTKEVFNLEVEGCPEYFANGILVHNCRYGLFSHAKVAKKPEDLVMRELAQELSEQHIPAHERAMQMRSAQAKIDAGKNKTYHYMDLGH